LSNDLYDERDRLIDELSNIVNIKVDYTSSGGDPLKIAQGIATVELVNDSGQPFDPPIVLVDGENGSYNKIDIQYTEGSEPYKVVTGIAVAGHDTDIDIMQSSGSLKGLIEAYGFGDQDNYNGEYPDVMDQLDKMAYEFAKAFNEAHKDGYDLNGELGVDFFVIEGLDFSET